MTKRELIPLTSYDQVPDGMTEDEAHEFWSTHAFSEEYIASAPPVPEDALPPFREPSKYQAIHLKCEIFQKVRRLARERGVRIDDLIVSLATQALAAEGDRGAGPRHRLLSEAEVAAGVIPILGRSGQRLCPCRGHAGPVSTLLRGLVEGGRAWLVLAD